MVRKVPGLSKTKPSQKSLKAIILLFVVFRYAISQQGQPNQNDNDSLLAERVMKLICPKLHEHCQAQTTVDATFLKSAKGLFRAPCPNLSLQLCAKVNLINQGRGLAATVRFTEHKIICHGCVKVVKIGRMEGFVDVVLALFISLIATGCVRFLFRIVCWFKIMIDVIIITNIAG